MGERSEMQTAENDRMVVLCERLTDHIAAAVRLSPSLDPDFLGGFLCGAVFDALGLEQVGWRCEEHMSGGTLVALRNAKTFDDCVLVPVYVLGASDRLTDVGRTEGTTS